MTKMTYAVALDVAINAVSDSEVREKLEALKVSIEKRNHGTRKPTKVQRENESLKEQMIEFLADGESYTASDVASQFGISNQKASALLNALVADSAVTKFVGEKRRTFFKVA